MAIFQYSEWIKTKREELGMTQEDLADGICATSSLSRIESGEHTPTKELLERILERLGYSNIYLVSYTNTQYFNQHELKYRIRQAYIENHLEQARTLLKKFEAECPDSKFNRQFKLTFNTIFYKDQLTSEEMLARFEEALKITCNKFHDLTLPKLLSFEEITLVNAIANCYFRLGRSDDAIHLFQQVKQFYDNQRVNREEALRTQPMILYNYSRILGQTARYDECIEICDQGIRICKSSGRATLLARLLYNKAWALEKRNQGTDRETARQYAVDAYHLAQIMGQEQFAAHCRAFLDRVFPSTSLV